MRGKTAGPLLLSGMLLWLAACGADPARAPVLLPPDPHPVILPAPDPAFRLTPEQRARLHPLDDPELVEQFLSWIRPEHRAEVLGSFTFWRDEAEQGRKVAPGPMQLEVDHPPLQEIVHRINLRRWPSSP